MAEGPGGLGIVGTPDATWKGRCGSWRRACSQPRCNLLVMEGTCQAGKGSGPLSGPLSDPLGRRNENHHPLESLGRRYCHGNIPPAYQVCWEGRTLSPSTRNPCCQILPVPPAAREIRGQAHEPRIPVSTAGDESPSQGACWGSTTHTAGHTEPRTKRGLVSPAPPRAQFQRGLGARYTASSMLHTGGAGGPPPPPRGPCDIANRNAEHLSELKIKHSVLKTIPNSGRSAKASGERGHKAPL